MCSFRYVSDISGYTEVLYHPKTSLIFVEIPYFRMVTKTHRVERAGSTKELETTITVQFARMGESFFAVTRVHESFIYSATCPHLLRFPGWCKIFAYAMLFFGLEWHITLRNVCSTKYDINRLLRNLFLYSFVSQLIWSST